MKNLYFFFSAMFIFSPAFADDSGNEQTVISTERQEVQQVPLVPGSEVNIGNNKKAKIWTTAGPVPVGQAPEPFKDKDEEVKINNGHIYVDVDAPHKPRTGK